MNTKLISSTSRVETPFIIATIGGYTFGSYSRDVKNIIVNNKSYKSVVTQFPNYMQSISVVKINGALNTYTLTMKYTIKEGDDPNLLEKVFSSISNDRSIKLSYGDLSLPTSIYKEEEGIITEIKSNFDMASSSITYILSCISKALTLNAGKFNFPKRVDKPSNVIKEILYNVKYGLLDIFYGMRDKNLVLSKGLIAGDDRTLTIEAKKQTSILDYLKYLVDCMISVSDSNNKIYKTSEYSLTIIDDTSGIFGGPYFKVNKVSSNLKSINSLDIYEVDIGYPGKDMVLNFSIDDNETYSILYNYANKIEQSEYVYRINNDGDIDYIYSPNITTSSNLMKTTQADRSWWSQVTQYPIKATLTLKGLLRPAILMSYVKINTLFFGRKHLSSGYYIITKQTDTVDASGYKTVLNLVRIQGDDV